MPGETGREHTEGASTPDQPTLFDDINQPVIYEDLPSLEPTAEVPHIHRDDRTTPDYWNDKLYGPDAEVPPEHRDDRLIVDSVAIERETASDDFTQTEGYVPPTPDLEHTPWWRTTAAKIGGLAAGSLLVIGSALGLNRQPNDNAEANQGSEVGLPQTEIVDDGLFDAPETLPNDGRPIYMTSNDASSLLKQFQHNESCMINSRDFEQQQVCAEHISDPAHASSQYQQLLMTIESFNSISPREFNPDHEFVREYELIDSERTDDVMTLIVHLVATEDTISGVPNRSEGYLRLEFTKSPIVLEDLTVDGKAQEVWFLTIQEDIAPGDIRTSAGS